MENHEKWAQEFGSTARAYWTPDRLEELTQGKELMVTPDTAAPLLRATGLLHRDGSMPDKERRKFFQLNHMLRLVRPPIEELAASGQTLHLVDAGCGRSYLTLSLAWCLEHVFRVPYSILGVDRNAKLIEDCTRRARMAGVANNLRFEAADLNAADVPTLWSSTFGTPLKLDGVVALHACDTATDQAIGLGLDHGAQLIAVAPCCQAELAAKWSALADAGSVGSFAPVWNTPHLRRELAATITDTFRTLLLSAAGFDTRTVEFVHSSHTPKNTLIRAMRRGEPDTQVLDQYRLLRHETGGAGIRLERWFDLSA